MFIQSVTLQSIAWPSGFIITRMGVSADGRLSTFPPPVFPHRVYGDSVLPAGCRPGQPFGDLIVFTLGADGCGPRMGSRVSRSQRACWHAGQGERRRPAPGGPLGWRWGAVGVPEGCRDLKPAGLPSLGGRGDREGLRVRAAADVPESVISWRRFWSNCGS